MRNYIHIITQ